MGARGAARQGDSSCLRESLMGRLIGCGRRQAQHLRRHADFVAARSDWRMLARRDERATTLVDTLDLGWGPFVGLVAATSLHDDAFHAAQMKRSPRHAGGD